MFKRQLKQLENEKTQVLALFNLLKSKGDRCVVSRDLVTKNNIELATIIRVLERLSFTFDITDREFIIYATHDALADRLDEEYPETESTEKESPLGKKATATAITSEEAPQKRVTSSASAAPVNTLLANCIAILDSVSGTTPTGEGKPYYSTPEQKAMLVDYIQAAVLGLEMRDDETQKQYDTRIRQSYFQCNTIKQQFSEQFLAHVACDDVNEPVIFSLFQSPLKTKEEQNKINRICRLFNYPLDQAQLLTTNKARLQQLFAKAQQAAVVIDTTSEVFQYLCTRAGLPARSVQVIPEAQTSELLSGDPLTHLTVHLVGNNEAMGYSLHNILVIAGVIPSEPYAGNLSQRFDEPTSFTLNHQQLKKLQDYLSDLSVWYRDFETILSSLFDEDAATYVKTGCKPLREAVKTEVVRERTSAPLFMTAGVRERFNAHPTESFLLFGQAAVDLSTHPHREAMRDLLQGFYNTNHLLDSKQEPKTFVVDERGELTFVSLLSIGHIRQIYNEVMAFSTLTKSAKEMGFSLIDYVEIVGAGDPRALYHTYLQLLLAEIAMKVIQLSPGENQTSKRRKAETMVSSLLPSARPHETLYDMYKRFQQGVQALLNDTTDIQRQPITLRADREPTQAEKLRLLEPIASQRSTFPASREFRIENATERHHVIDHLRACPAYQIASDAYVQYVVSTGAQPITAAQRYSPDTIYMHPTLDTCIQALAGEFGRRQVSDELTTAQAAFLSIALKLVYAQKMSIPRTAIERLSTRFADIFKVEEGRADLSQGCNTGLAGRMLTIESQLIAAEDNPFLQFNKQLLIDEAEISFNSTLGSSRAGESSMSARYKPLANIGLGLQAGNPTQLTSLRSASMTLQAFMSNLASRYTPGFIFEKCYEYICENFSRCIRDDDNEAMEALLGSLGYTEADFSQFQIADKWNIKRFELSLPEKLIEQLISNHLLTPGTGQLVIQATGQRFSIREAIAAAHAPRQQATPASREGFFEQRPPRPQPASATPRTWGNAGGLYQPAAAAAVAAPAVDLRGESKQAAAPGTGSTG